MRKLWAAGALILALGAGACGDSEEPEVDAGVTPPVGNTGNTGKDGGDGPDGGGDPDGGSPPGGDIPFAQWCATVERGFKNQLLLSESACGQTSITDDDLPYVGSTVSGTSTVNGLTLGTVMSCTPTSVLGVYSSAFEAAIQAGRMTYDAKKAGECRALELTSASTTDLFDESYSLIEPCGSVLTGNVAIGQACELNEECVDGAYCNPAEAGSCGGICTARIAVGAACVPGRELCVVSASCIDDGAGGGVCQEHSDVGEACDELSGPRCKAGLTCGSGTCIQPAGESGACTSDEGCEGELTCIAGSCTAPAALGAECGSGIATCGECLRCQDTSEVEPGAPTLCVASSVGATCRTDTDCPSNSYCVPGNQTCEVKPKNGQSCFVTGDPLPTEAARGNCLYADAFCKRANADSAEGVCSPPPKLNEPCGTGVDRTSCAEGFCGSGGVCVAPLTEGADCTTSDECAAGLYCSTTCTPLPGPGEPCATGSNEQCASGAWCQDPGTGDAPMCVAQVAAGEACTDDDQCAEGSCNTTTGTCLATCTTNYDNPSCGCPGEGAKGFTMYLIFALVLLPLRARRKSSQRQ